MQIVKETHIEFLRWRWHAIAVSCLLIMAGVVALYARGGLPLGIDFSGGTIVVIKFHQSVTVGQVRGALDPLPGEKVVQNYGQASANEILVRLPELITEEGASLERGATQILDAIGAGDLGSFEIISTEIVGPVIGEALQRKGIYATLAALFGILVYISFRFRFSFAVGAVVALICNSGSLRSCLYSIA